MKACKNMLTFNSNTCGGFWFIL